MTTAEFETHKAEARRLHREYLEAREQGRVAKQEHAVAVSTFAARLNDLRRAYRRALGAGAPADHPELNEIRAAIEAGEAKLALIRSWQRSEKSARTVAVRAVPSGSVVYFVQGVDGGPIKIGTTKDLAQRLESLQIGSPIKLRVLATVSGEVALETAFHRRLKEHRVHGEWFSDCDDVRRVIAEACQ